MIIDKDKRFLFIHNPRTGGSSIRKVLHAYQDYGVYEKMWKHLSNTNFSRASFSHTDHCSLEMFPDDAFNEYKYIFTCVRNPFSRTYSFYKKISTAKLHMASFGWASTTFADIVGSMHKLCTSQDLRERYDSIIVFPYDFWTFGTHEVIRFEDLHDKDTWNQLMRNCGIDGEVERPHENRLYEHDPLEYREHYTDSMREKMYDMFQKEIETYGYEF